ncbi:hypothetical protein [Promicromonospora soli]
MTSVLGQSPVGIVASVGGKEMVDDAGKHRDVAGADGGVQGDVKCGVLHGVQWPVEYGLGQGADQGATSCGDLGVPGDVVRPGGAMALVQ